MATSSDPPSPNPGTNPSKVLSTMDEDRDSVSDFRNWAEIQRDVLVSIFEKVGMIGVLSSAELVCSPWRKVSKEESRLWRRIHVGMDRKTTGVTGDKLKTMVKRAVDRSKGALEEFWINRCCDAKLLRYTGARASNLKSLRLVECIYKAHALVNVLQNLKQLEELELTYCRFRVDELEAIGQACPLLSRFKLKEVVSPLIPRESVDDEAAIGISKTMHQLRYLQLFGGRLTDKGVKAILQGCRNLETLDVRECCNVKLDTETINLCARLKTLIHPRGKLSEESEFASEADRKPPLYLTYEEIYYESLYLDGDEADRESPLYLSDDDYYNEGNHIDGDDFFDYLSS